MKVALIAAVARNGVIGHANDLLWKLPEDMAFFRRTTLGNPVIMGRRTWDSLPRKPLPGRLNLVLTRDGAFEPQGALAFEDFAEALPRAKRLYLTEVDAEVEGDTRLAAFDESQWREVRREAYPAGPDDDHPFVFRVLERR